MSDLLPCWWPTPEGIGPPSGVVVATVNYNTKDLTARLLWSLYRFTGREVQSVVVMDNGSTDGSVELLQAMADAGLCHLIANPQNRHHGPALSQAVSHVAATGNSPAGQRPWIWLLDSDCVVARSGTVAACHAAAVAAGAGLVGESYWNRWNQEFRFYGFSLWLDPVQAWRSAIGAIPAGGDPIGDFQQACRQSGVTELSFPFAREGYLIHLGRGTLAEVHRRGEESNPHYEWARSHHQPHYQEVADAPDRYAALMDDFHRDVVDLSPEALVRACLLHREQDDADG